MGIERDNYEARQLLDAIDLLNELVQKNSPDVDKQITQVENNFKWYLDSIKK